MIWEIDGAVQGDVASSASGDYIVDMNADDSLTTTALPLPILLVPAPILKARAKPVQPEDAEIVAQLVPRMFAAMYAAPGIGLAAPQVGVSLRLVVVDLMTEGQSAPMTLINPEIAYASKATATREEGCLSLPGQYADVTRPAQVSVRFTDPAGAKHEISAEGLLAACLQHEIDHLDGVLFVDHISALRRNMILRRMAKERRLREGGVASMRLAFMGSPAFSVPILHALQQAGHEIVAVYTQPPRPAGRGQRAVPCPVHAAAEALGLPVRTPERVRRDETAHAAFAALDLDAAVVAAYGLILPQPMLDAPTRGCLNVHASLLPRWRGASPIQSAVLAGDTESGVTIMRMEAGLDTGPMLLREAVPITPATTGASLHDELSLLGARLILRALDENPTPVAQPEGATYAPKLSREDGHIKWTEPAPAIERRVRAFDPWPGTFTLLEGSVLKILGAEAIESKSGPPGTVLSNDFVIACGAGALRPTRVQRAGKAALDISAFLRGHSIRPGIRLG